MQKAESKAAFARRIGVSSGRMTHLIREGLPVREDGKIEIEAGLAWVQGNLDQARRAAAKSSFENYSEARFAAEVEKVRRARLEYDKASGALVDKAEAERVIFERARAERDALMGWAMRVAPVLAAELGADERALFAALERELRAELAALAERPLVELAK